jgi:hypothetical protein
MGTLGPVLTVADGCTDLALSSAPRLGPFEHHQNSVLSTEQFPNYTSIRTGWRVDDNVR